MNVVLTLVVVVAVFSAATLWRAARNEAAAVAAYPPAGLFIEVNGTRVHYIDEGEGPVVVLIHGSSGNLNDWTFHMVGQLSAHYRVIAFDRPGLGYTDRIGRGAPLADQARLLADATTLLGAETPIIVGHSYGATVALAWALERPENISGLVVLAGVSNPWDTGLSTYYQLMSNRILGPITANVVTAWVPEQMVDTSTNTVFAPQSAPEGYGAHFGPGLTLRRFSLLENARQRAALLAQVEVMAPRYPDITVPTEILHGDADTIVGLPIHSIPLSQQIPDAILTVMPGVGHMPQHADPQAIVDAITRLTLRAGLR